MQALQAPSLQRQRDKVKAGGLYIVVTPAYEQELQCIQLSAHLGTANAQIA